MGTQGHTAAMLVVFAGGPHTASRAALAASLIRALQPCTVVLTGQEFLSADYGLRNACQDSASPCDVIVDAAQTSLASCQHLASRLRGLDVQAIAVTLVTSNYHAPRVRWLLRPLLPIDCRLHVRTSPDIRLCDLRSSRRARRLIRGEIMSWAYSLPLGLLWWMCRLLHPPLPRHERGGGEPR